MDDRAHLDFMLCWSGKKFFPADPRPDDFLIEDIAHHLSLMNRYNGATKYAYSVGLHSVNCSYMASSPETAMQALLHDAPESYIADINSPAKRLLPDYEGLETDVWAAISMKFNVPFHLDPEVKEIDLRMLVTEAPLLMRQGVYEWWTEAHFPKPYKTTFNRDLRFHRMEPVEVETLFLMRFEELKAKCNA